MHLCDLIRQMPLRCPRHGRPRSGGLGRGYPLGLSRCQMPKYAVFPEDFTAQGHVSLMAQGGLAVGKCFTSSLFWARANWPAWPTAPLLPAGGFSNERLGGFAHGQAFHAVFHRLFGGIGSQSLFRAAKADGHAVRIVFEKIKLV